MAWIYLAVSEASQKPWKDTSDQSPTVKQTDTLPPVYCLECGLATYQGRPSGTTCERCERATLNFYRTSFMVASPAKTFPLPDAEQAWAASAAAFSSRSLGLSAKYDLLSSSWRTSQLLLFEEASELLASFAGYGMTVGGEFYPLVMWERITGGSDGGSLPSDGRMWMTPKAGNCGMTARTKGRPLNRSTHLQAQVHCEEKKMWPTPCQPNNGGTNGKAKLKAMLWRTPLGTDGEKSGWGNLPHQAKKWPTPRAFMHKDSTTDRGKGNLGEVVGGQLNPTFVEFLMGYQKDWTVLGPWAEAWKRRK